MAVRTRRIRCAMHPEQPMQQHVPGIGIDGGILTQNAGSVHGVFH